MRGIIVGFLLLSAQAAHAEMYVGGQIGAHLPEDVSDVQWSAGGPAIGGSDIALDTSFMYGAKLGFYFDQLPWLGLETEVYNATPHVNSQSVTIGVLPLTLRGTLHRVLTWSPVVVVARYQMGQFEPYAGVGMGVFFSHFSSGSQASSDTAVGLTSQVGLRYRINQHLAAFGEWKYNMASLSHAVAGLGPGVNVEGDYRAHILAFGLGYHF